MIKMTSLYSLTFVKYVYSSARSQIGSKSTNYHQDPNDGAGGYNLLVASLSSMHLLLDSILGINGHSVTVNACDASIGKVEGGGPGVQGHPQLPQQGQDQTGPRETIS